MMFGKRYGFVATVESVSKDLNENIAQTFSRTVNELFFWKQYYYDKAKAIEEQMKVK